jgi:hypothetical protein
MLGRQNVNEFVIPDKRRLWCFGALETIVPEKGRGDEMMDWRLSGHDGDRHKFLRAAHDQQLKAQALGEVVFPFSFPMGMLPIMAVAEFQLPNILNPLLFAGRMTYFLV